VHFRLTIVSGLTAAQMEAVMHAIEGDWLPRLAGADGFLGFSVFGNPDSGRGGLATSWTSREAMQDAEEAEHGLQAAAIAASDYRRTPVVETYEMLSWAAPSMAERQRPMRVRLGRVSGLTRADLEPVQEAIREAWIPQMSRLPGVLGYSVFGNIETGKGGMSTLWSSREAIIASEAAEQRVYAAAAKAAGYRGERVVDRYEMFAWEVPTMDELERLAG